MEKNQKDDRLKNIRKIRDGVYEIQLSNGFRDDGKRDRISETVYGSEEDAITRREEMKADLKLKKEKGLKTSNDGYTFLEVTKMFLEDRKYSKRVGTTKRGYKVSLNNYILPTIGMKKLRNITTEDLENLYDKLSKQISKSTNAPLATTTIRRCHVLIKVIFNYAIHKKWTFYNPAEFVENAPKGATPEREYYDHEEILKVFECLEKLPSHINGVNDKIVEANNIRFKTAIMLLFNSGLRREEMIALKWKDIKWNTHIIEVRRAVVTVKSTEFDPEDILEEVTPSLVCKNLKNDSSRRNIKLPTVCFDYLLQYKNNQISLGFIPNDEDYIFQNIRSNMGSLWNPNNLTRHWLRFIKTFNLKKITIHDIRHSHATELLSMGIPIQDVSRRLGHADVATTLKIYTHSNLEQDKLIALKLENVYGNHYVLSRLDFKIISSIITGENYTDEQEIINAVNFITGEMVTNENKNILFSKCKSYLLDNFKYLESINIFLNSNIQPNVKESFINLVTNFNNDLSNIRPMNEL